MMRESGWPLAGKIWESRQWGRVAMDGTRRARHEHARGDETHNTDCKIRAGFSGWSVYQKLEFSLKINISLHNWTSKHICSIRYTQYVYSSVYFILDSQEMTVPKTKKLPKKSAAFGGRLLVLFWGLKYSHFLGVQNKIYTYWVYLMEHICFEVQLCSEILIFNENSNF